MLDKLTTADFAPHLNTTFAIELSDGEITRLTLVSVKEANPRYAVPGVGRMPFTLLFHAPHTRGYLPQQTWQLDHAILGQIKLFLVPVGRDADGMQYEAVFN